MSSKEVCTQCKGLGYDKDPRGLTRECIQCKNTIPITSSLVGKYKEGNKVLYENSPGCLGVIVPSAVCGQCEIERKDGGTCTRSFTELEEYNNKESWYMDLVLKIEEATQSGLEPFYLPSDVLYPIEEGASDLDLTNYTSLGYGWYYLNG